VFTGIDHLVILVPKLDDAMARYRELGFQVLQGGEHPGGTHNALITFQDGSYLELIAFQEPEKPHDHRWYRFLDRPGMVDFAIGAENVETELERVRAGGLAYEGPKPGARRRPDGEQLRWRTAPPPDERTGELPFLIDDVSARSLRVPGGDASAHDNGVTGIRRLTLAVRDLDEAVAEFETLLGTGPSESGTDDEIQASAATFACGHHWIRLAYPTAPDSPLVHRIQQRGDGPCEVELTSSAASGRERLDPTKTGGARLVIELG
jgi:catechol 2,3-dioxygenase-like lactoylglutathione lyase family enzyme